EAAYFLPSDVILVTVDDGSARLLDMAGSFHAVPAVGARMLKETLANGAGAAATRIAADYGVDRQQVQNDLAVYLGDLEKQGLLCRERSRRGRPGDGAGLARLLLRPWLEATHRLLRSPEAKARSLLALARLSCTLFGWSRTIVHTERRLVTDRHHDVCPARGKLAKAAFVCLDGRRLDVVEREVLTLLIAE